MLQPAPYVPPTPASWHYQLALPVTFLHALFLFLLHQSGIHYLHTFALSTISVHLSVISNHTFSSQLSLSSHSVPAPLIRSLRFWRSINLVVCMYVCMLLISISLLATRTHVWNILIAMPIHSLTVYMLGFIEVFL